MMKYFCTCIIIFIFFFSSIKAADTTSDSIAVDTAEQNCFSEKLPARKSWEYVVSSPLWIVTSPLYFTYRLIAAGIGFIDDHHLAEKLKNLLVLEDGSIKLNPYYSSSTGIGIICKKEELFNTDAQFKIAGSFGTLRRHGIESSCTGVPLARRRLFLDASAIYHHVPDEPFFGIGTQNSSDDEMAFSFNNVSALLALRASLTPSFDLFVAGVTDYYNLKGSDKEHTPSVPAMYSASELPTGFNSRAMFGGIMTGFIIDTRDCQGHTHHGTLFKAHTGFKQELEIDRFNDNRTGRFGLQHITADFRYYEQLPWGKHRILVLRSAIEHRLPHKDKEIPVYFLSTLGEDGTIRGFTRGRFRDNDYILGSVEYHYPIWEDIPNLLSAVLFCDAGQVTPDIIHEFNASKMHLGFGGGFRFYRKNNLIGALLFGFSKDDFRIEFSLGDESLTRILDIIRQYSEL